MNHQLFSRCLGSLYETTLDPENWGTAIRDIGELFSASTASMFQYDFETRRPSDFRIWNFDPEVERRYAEYYHRIDPAAPHAMAAPVGLWQSDETLLYVASEAHREYLHDFALRSNIGRVGGVKVAGNDRGCLYLSFQRPPGSDRFGDTAQQIYAHLEPHIKRVESIRARLRDACDGERIAKRVLDRIRCGMLVCTGSGRVLLANHLGAKALNSHGALTLRHGRLMATNAELQLKLQSALRNACSWVNPTGSALSLSLSARTHLQITSAFVVPVPPGNELAKESYEPIALIALAKPPTDPGPVDLIRQLFDLTGAETAVLSALLGGKSVQQYAASSGIKVSTVRSHLHALLTKTGAVTQAGLANLARGLPPI